MVRLQQEFRTAMILVTHDLGVIAETCEPGHRHVLRQHRRGGPTANSSAIPRHPYTAGLLASVPARAGRASCRELPVIPGMVPDLRHLPPPAAASPTAARAAWRAAAADHARARRRSAMARSVACFNPW
jgi:ABC-type dipeptide/oligopeptide/nickel transport system ATPase component